MYRISSFSGGETAAFLGARSWQEQVLGQLLAYGATLAVSGLEVPEEALPGLYIEPVVE